MPHPIFNVALGLKFINTCNGSKGFGGQPFPSPCHASTAAQQCSVTGQQAAASAAATTMLAVHPTVCNPSCQPMCVMEFMHNILAVTAEPASGCLTHHNTSRVVHIAAAVGAVLLQWWMWEVVVLLAGLLPNAEVAVAVTGLSTQIQTIPWILCYSLGTATATRVAQALGAGDADKAARLCRWVGWLMQSGGSCS